MQAHRLSLICLSLTLSGCTVFEALGGMPKAHMEMPVPSGVTTEEVFAAVESSVDILRRSGFWSTRVTRRDTELGVLETGNYTATNVMGFRVRARFDETRSLLSLTLKGAGIVYADLGVDRGIQDLAVQIAEQIKTQQRVQEATREARAP